MYLWEWYVKRYNREERIKELEKLSRQPSKINVWLQVAQNWLDRRWPNCRINEILEPDYEWNFKKWLTIEIVNE